jgi:xylulose-5-phosphate/fructose-6-phosphate phosphoketolase
VRDGAVLPILHLNGYKIAESHRAGAYPPDELEALFRATATRRISSKATTRKMHQLMAATLDVVVADIRRIQGAARANGFKPRRPRWPMIILRSPKGWTGPKMVDGKKTEDSWRSHQVPMGDMAIRGM